MMKKLLICLIITMLGSSLAKAEITREDWEKFKEDMKAEISTIKTEISAMKAEISAMKTEMTLMEARLKEYVDLKFQLADTKVEERTKAIQAEISGLRAEISGLRKSLHAEIGGLRESIDAIKWWVVTLTGLVFVLIALPQILNFFRERRETKETARLQEQITELREKLGLSSQQDKKTQK